MHKEAIIFIVCLFSLSCLLDAFQFEAIGKDLCVGVEPPLKDSESCLSAQITIEQYSNKTIVDVLSNIESFNSRVRGAKISFAKTPTSTEMLYIGEHLDKFLGPNMWWSVLAEPFSWHANNKEGIILERYHASFEPFLRLLSAIQYPDSQTCSKTPLIVSRADMVHPGWGSVVEFKYMIHSLMVFITTVTYTSKSNRPAEEKTAFMNANECNTTNNKWDCAFLPETNCTIPDFLTKCTGVNCISQYPDAFHGCIVMSSADASGKLIPQKEASLIREHAYHNHSFIQPYSQKQMKLWQHPHSTNPPGYSMAPIFNSSFPVTFPGGPGSASTTYWFRFYLRGNYYFRSLIAEQIHNFYHKNNMNFNTRCVTAQVRRGDRIIKGVDMFAFCKNATRPISADNPINYCQDASGHLQNCQGGIGSDKGCTSPVPFGGVTMDMIVKAAEQLVAPEVRTIIVLTDDEPWFNSERARVQHKYPQWKIVSLEAPKSDVPVGTAWEQEHNKMNYADGYAYMRFQGGSKSGSFYLASLQLAQQCEAFIGHHDSSATGMFKASMCYKSKNGLQQGICPPVYDLRTGKV